MAQHEEEGYVGLGLKRFNGGLDQKRLSLTILKGVDPNLGGCSFKLGLSSNK